jgi:hypothetical protein
MASENRIDELRRWRDEAASQLERAQQDLQSSQRRVDEARERLMLLDRLLAVEGDERRSDIATTAPASSDLLDVCERIMRQAGRPLHIRDLHAALLSEGVTLPGRGTEANLIVRLQRSNGRFLRTGRGTYAPASFGVPERRPMRRRRVSRASMT